MENQRLKITPHFTPGLALLMLRQIALAQVDRRVTSFSRFLTQLLCRNMHNSSILDDNYPRFYFE
jgi:hypothetical protein